MSRPFEISSAGLDLCQAFANGATRQKSIASGRFGNRSSAFITRVQGPQHSFLVIVAPCATPAHFNQQDQDHHPRGKIFSLKGLKNTNQRNHYDGTSMSAPRRRLDARAVT